MTEESPSVLISIVVPAYNYGPGLLKLVDHFLECKDTDFEILIVDDGSKDETEKIFSNFRHPQLKYLRKTNGERGAARNYGADLAAGRYVCFFDQDDHPFPNFVSEAKACLKAFDNPDVFCFAEEVRTRNGVFNIQDLPDPLNQRLLSGNVTGCGGIFVKKEIFKVVRFEESREIVGSEDWLFLLQLSARFPVRFWNKITWAYLDTGNNSVYSFTETQLNKRTELLLQYLRNDRVFMARYGKFLQEIAAMRDVYTALHLALSGKIYLPFIYLKRAFLKSLRGFARKGVLGTVKAVLKNVLSHLCPPRFRPATK